MVERLRLGGPVMKETIYSEKTIYPVRRKEHLRKGRLERGFDISNAISVREA